MLVSFAISLQCSVHRFEGVQYRAVQCQASKQILDSTNCSIDTKPPTVRTCGQANCNNGQCCRWVPRNWKKVIIS